MRRAVVLGAMLVLPACTKQDEEAQPQPVQPEPEPPTKQAPAEQTAPAGDGDGGGKGIGLGNAIAEAVGLAKAPVAGLNLLPGAATLVAGIDLAGVSKTASWDVVQSMFTGGAGDAFRAVTTCKLGPETWRRATLAADPTTDSTAVVFEAAGVGKAETLACLHDELQKTLGREPWTLDEEAGGKRLEFDGGIGLVVSDNVIVMTSKRWEDAVLQRREGTGPAAGEGDLEPLLARTDRSKHLWLAAMMPPDARVASAAALGSPAEDITAWIDLSGGMELQLAVGVDDPPTTRKKLDEVWAQSASTATAVGLPQAFVDSVKFGETDGAVTLEARATDAELETISAAFSKMFGSF